MEKENELGVEHVEVEAKPEKAERPVTCRGSFRIGTACGECARCKAAGFGPEEKKAAMEAEAERTKDLPADRVKPDGYAQRRTEEQLQRERTEIKEELKPEMKEEIKEELRPEIEEKIEEKVKEEKEKPVDPAPVDPDPKKK